MARLLRRATARECRIRFAAFRSPFTLSPCALSGDSFEAGPSPLSRVLRTRAWGRSRLALCCAGAGSHSHLCDCNAHLTLSLGPPTSKISNKITMDRALAVGKREATTFWKRRK